MSWVLCKNGQHWFGFSDEPQDICTCGEWLYSGAWGWHPSIELGPVAEPRLPFLIRLLRVEQAAREVLPILDAHTQMLRTLPYESKARVHLREVDADLRAALALEDSTAGGAE